jgi:hypothetical protein
MATQTTLRGMTATDRILAWAMMAGLAAALLRSAEAAVLPAHFV